MTLKQLMDAYSIDVVILFGSQARSESSPLSDHDIAIFLDPNEFAPFSLSKHLALLSDLESILERQPISLVVLNSAPIGLAYRILKEGKILSARKLDDFESFRAKKWTEYFDFEPIEELFARQALKAGG
ncbi:MAG: type VII toxin-antitoxin system MntA family adenylyltransferase antitoxin [Candidatus Hodarchaeales archaeon]